MSLQLLTSSRIKVFRRCAKLHDYEFLQGYRPVEDAEALRFGSLLHKGLEAWWKALAEHNRGEINENDVLSMAQIAVSEMPDAFMRVKAHTLLAGYHFRWIEEDLEPLAVEAEFRAPLINPETNAPSKTYELAGKLDVIAREASTGRIVIVEHKSTSESFAAGSVYRNALKLNNQISIYFAGAKALGYDVAEAIYDVIGKPAIKPGSVPLTDEQGVKIVLDANGVRVCTKDGKKWRETGDTAAGYVLQTRPETPEEYGARLVEDRVRDPEKYFARIPVVRLEDELREHAFDLWQTAKIMRTSEVTGCAPKNDDGCFRYGRACSFLPVCVRESSLDDSSRYVKLEHVHPELEGGAGASAA